MTTDKNALAVRIAKLITKIENAFVVSAGGTAVAISAAAHFQSSQEWMLRIALFGAITGLMIWSLVQVSNWKKHGT